MATLRITVEWLDGIYHGREWPPSPFRLYQAMIAGYAVHRRGDPELEAALRHLETRPPPVIFAPEAEERRPVRSSVPNNDGDIAFGHLARGQDDKARKSMRKARTIRERRPRVFESAVTYEWEAAPETITHLPVLRTIGESVSAVGHGIDAAVARTALVEHPAPVKGVQYTPSPAGVLRLDVPYPGAFDALEERFQRFRGRVGSRSVSGVPEAPRQSAAYASDRDPPPVRHRAFRLLDMRDSPLAFEGIRTMEVAAMTRHAMGIAARNVGLDPATVSDLMGHGGSRRIRAQPLPNVGHQYADGRIRRVLLTAPKSVREEDWLDVVTRMIGAELVPLGGTGPVGILEPAEDGDRMVARYCCRSVAWTTATPVVLPGRDCRRGRPRPVRSVRRLLRHAGIPEGLVEEVAMEPAGLLTGSAAPKLYRRPRHLSDWPCTHISVRWRSPIAGPLVLGAGAGYGLGLFLPLDDCRSTASASMTSDIPRLLESGKGL